jgi:hypothetical protein
MYRRGSGLDWLRSIGVARLVLGVAGAVVTSTGPLFAQSRWLGDTLDHGVGIISFESFAELEPPAADTLVIYRSASVHSPVVARFLLLVPEPFVWGYALEAEEDGIQSNALEFDYEELGLPVDSMGAGGDWLRVVYGMGSEATPRRGWVWLGGGGAKYQLWVDVLRERPLFFAASANIEFWDRPAGERVLFDLEEAETESAPSFDYRMEPLEVEGAWMKVRVETPDDMCEPSLVQIREFTTWIQFLDQRGRPRLWYYPRGC